MHELGKEGMINLIWLDQLQCIINIPPNYCLITAGIFQEKFRGIPVHPFLFLSAFVLLPSCSIAQTMHANHSKFSY